MKRFECDACGQEFRDHSFRFAPHLCPDCSPAHSKSVDLDLEIEMARKGQNIGAYWCRPRFT